MGPLWKLNETEFPFSVTCLNFPMGKRQGGGDVKGNVSVQCGADSWSLTFY